MRFELYSFNKTADLSDPFDTIDCINLTVAGNSMIFWNYYIAKPIAVYPASKFYALGVENG